MGNVPTKVESRKNTYFPPEIIEKILEKLSLRDKLICKQVCRDWFSIILSLDKKLVQEVIVQVEDSDTFFPFVNEAQLDIIWNTYTFNSIDFDRSLFLFWRNYGEFITHLSFNDCFFPSQCNVQEESNLCPNLVNLEVKNCEKYFMIGGEFLQIHKILNIKNLKKLSLANNKYLTDFILFSFLFEIESLESLDLSNCPLTFQKVLFKRFYPGRTDAPAKLEDFAQHLLSFHTIYKGFLSTDRANCLKSINLSSTWVNCEALSLIQSCENIHLEELYLNRCFELKPPKLFELIESKSNYLKVLHIASLCTSLDKLKDLKLPKLEEIIVEDFDNTTLVDNELTFLINSPNLRILNASRSTGFKLENLKHLLKLNVLKINSLINFVSKELAYENIQLLVNLTQLEISHCEFFADDHLCQLICQHLEKLQVLNLTRSKITDLGVAGKLIEEYDDRLSSKAIDEMKAKYLRNMDRPKGYSLCRLKDLKKVSFNFCLHLGEATWKFALRLPNLTKLNLAGCTQLSTKGVREIVKNCKSLEHLDISCCGLHISGDEGLIQFIRAKLNRLRNLEL